MRHSTLRRFSWLGVLICTALLGLAACEEEADEPTGLEVEEAEIEREDGQIESAEIELEREELGEIDRPADEELVEALRRDEQQAEGAAGEQAQQMQPGQMQPGQMEPGQMEQDQLADQQRADQQQPGQQQPSQQQQQDFEAALVAPIDYIGMPVSGEATVADVVSDRGFWLTDGQNRIFAVVREYDERIDINEGQRIRLSGIIMAPADASDVVGPLEPQTKRLVEEQTAFVSVFWRNIEILEQADEAPVGGGPDEQEQQPMDQPQNQQ